MAYKGVIAASWVTLYDAGNDRVHTWFQKAVIDRLETNSLEICLCDAIINTWVALSCGEFGLSDRRAREGCWGGNLKTISQSYAGALEEEAISLGSTPFHVNESSTQTIPNFQLIDRPCKKHCGCLAGCTNALSGFVDSNHCRVTWLIQTFTSWGQAISRVSARTQQNIQVQRHSQLASMQERIQTKICCALNDIRIDT